MQVAGMCASPSIMENQVEVNVVNRASFDEKLAVSGLTLPVPVEVSDVPAHDEDD